MIFPAMLGLYSVVVGGIGILVNIFEVVDSQNRNHRIKRLWLVFFFLVLGLLGLTSLIQLMQ